MKNLLKVIENIDWDLLKAQKTWLIEQNNPNANGLVSLLDVLQDAIVNDNICDELEVFPEDDIDEWWDEK